MFFGVPARKDFMFSSVISLGSSSDVDFGEILDYLVNDPTRADEWSGRISR